ncbi:MAG: hypothetical protein ACTIOQ_15105 [Serratia grimesii]|uniref:hypothetical protein n=1 Tax=Serratia grimesii TaxID=82995 RepID=UPI003F94A306
MRKSPISAAIEAEYNLGHYISDSYFYVQAHVGRHYLWIRPRCAGKSYFVYQQQLIQQELKRSAGATLKFLLAGQSFQRWHPIVGFDLGHEEQSVECVFQRDAITGALTLVSTDVVDRLVLNVGEWPPLSEWRALSNPCHSSVDEFYQQYALKNDGWSWSE